jgi:hypothetical protein
LSRNGVIYSVPMIVDVDIVYGDFKRLGQGCGAALEGRGGRGAALWEQLLSGRVERGSG